MRQPTSYDRFVCEMSRATAKRPVGVEFQVIVIIAQNVIDIDDVLIKSDVRRCVR